jgi:hypothetical protein
MLAAMESSEVGGIDGESWEEAKARSQAELGARSFRRCRVCGCSELDACEDGCGWAAEDLCTACIEKTEEPARTAMRCVGAWRVSDDNTAVILEIEGAVRARAHAYTDNKTGDLAWWGTALIDEDSRERELGIEVTLAEACDSVERVIGITADRTAIADILKCHVIE